MKSDRAYHSGRLGHRHGLMLLAFTGCLFMYATRVGLSVAMVAMTIRSSSNTTSAAVEVCPMGEREEIGSESNSSKSIPPSSRQYNWSTETQGILHGSFFYGYLISQIPGGWVAHRIGAKIPITVSMTCIGILTIISPFAADGGVWVFFLVRFLVGFCQGVTYPSITVLWSEWAPPAERGRLLSFSYSGMQVGTVVGMFLAGYLSQALGWESVFYCFGVFCLVWVVPWWLLAYDSPHQHPRISRQEKEYISLAINPDGKTANVHEKQATPWILIFKTVPVWALLFVEFGHNYGFYTLVTNLPTYLSNILHFSLKSSGTLSAMPYLCRFCITTSAIFLADWIRGGNFCSPTVLRKAFSIASFVCAGSAMVGVAFAGCNSTLAVVMFTIAVGMSGCVYVGYMINYTEMSPNYAGILIGLGNTVGTVTGIVAPLVVGVLTSGEGGQSIGNWQTVFFIAAGLYACVAIIYAIFGSAARQPWDSFKPISKS